MIEMADMADSAHAETIGHVATKERSPGDVETFGFLADGRELRPTPPPRYVQLLAGCASLNSCNFGFDIGVSSGVAILLQKDIGLTDWQLGTFLGSLYFTACLGALTSHAVSDRLGRRRTFTVAQILFLLGIPLLCFGSSFHVLLVGRTFLGLGVGVGFAIDSLYICEVAPAAHRGKLATWAEIAVNFGILLGFVANWAFRDLPAEGGLNWRVMISCGAILPLVMVMLSLVFIPESPRWLIANGRSAEAEAILRQTHPEGEDIAAVLEAIETQIIADKAHASLSSLELLRKEPGTLRMAMMGLGVGVSQQINGSESVVMFSPVIFEQAGVANSESELFAMSILVGFSKLIFILVAACVLDSLGRRPLFITSMASMAICLLLLGISIAIQLSWLSVVAVCSYIAAFSIGAGPVCWLLAAELFPMHIRARAMSLATASNRLTSGLVALTFLPLSGLLGEAAYFVLFSFITAGVALVAFAVVPETKGRILEDVCNSMDCNEQAEAKDADEDSYQGSGQQEVTL